MLTEVNLHDNVTRISSQKNLQRKVKKNVCLILTFFCKFFRSLFLNLFEVEQLFIQFTKQDLKVETDNI